MTKVETPSRKLSKALWARREQRIIQSEEEKTVIEKFKLPTRRQQREMKIAYQKDDFGDLNDKALEEWECRPTEEEILQNKRNNWLASLCPHAQTVKPT